MRYAKLIEKIETLPIAKQVEVFDFVDFLASSPGRTADSPALRRDWTDIEFAEMAMRQALRGMEDEPALYTVDDLKERWS